MRSNPVKKWYKCFKGGIYGCEQDASRCQEHVVDRIEREVWATVGELEKDMWFAPETTRTKRKNDWSLPSRNQLHQVALDSPGLAS